MTRHGRATLADVARLAGVSASTASLTFSGSGPVSPATRERVLAAAKELGFSGPDPLARSLRRGESGVVGVITNELVSSFRDPVTLRTLDGLADALGAHDLGMLLIRAGEAGEGADLVRRAAMDAAVFLRPVGPGERVVDLLTDRGINVVLLESLFPGAASVQIADRTGMAELTARVRDLGHTRVAVVSLPWGPGEPSGLRADAGPDENAFPFTLRRIAGIHDAGVVPTQVYVSRGSLVEEGFEAAKVLLQQDERPTAIMACSDLLAAGVLLAARELGLAVPRDLSITGFDGVDLPWLAPDVIDSVEQPATRKGQLGGEAAVALMAGGEPTRTELAVVQRPGTTLGPAPAGA